MTNAIFDLISASNADILDRYERVRTRPSREADALLKEIARRLRATENCGRLTISRDGRPHIYFVVRDGEVHRRPINRFGHLKAKTRAKIYRFATQLPPHYFEYAS